MSNPQVPEQTEQTPHEPTRWERIKLYFMNDTIRTKRKELENLEKEYAVKKKTYNITEDPLTLPDTYHPVIERLKFWKISKKLSVISCNSPKK
jgi:hypothetical protein